MNPQMAFNQRFETVFSFFLVANLMNQIHFVIFVLSIGLFPTVPVGFQSLGILNLHLPPYWGHLPGDFRRQIRCHPRFDGASLFFLTFRGRLARNETGDGLSFNTLWKWRCTFLDWNSENNPRFQKGLYESSPNGRVMVGLPWFTT